MLSADNLHKHFGFGKYRQLKLIIMNVVTKVEEEYFQGILEIFNIMYSLCDRPLGAGVHYDKMGLITK